MTSFDLDLSKYHLGWSDEVEYAFTPKKGLNEDVVDEISWWKGEPQWMTQYRKRSLRHFERKPMAKWFAVNMPDLDFQDIYYYLKPSSEQVDEWDDLPEQMKATYEKLGIPEAERKYLAGVTAQYESEVVYHRNREDLERRGSCSPTWTRRCASTPSSSSGTSARSSRPATTSSPRSTRRCGRADRSSTCRRASRCEMPLQAYFRINSENAGQFERTLIIADEGSQVHYIEGCSAPVYTTDSLHSAVVEIVVKPSARITYTTIQNWSPNVYNLVTKRARVEAEGHVEWIDGNIGSRLDDEVPVRVPGRAEGHGRGAVGRLRRRRPAPGRRGEDGPRRARDDVDDRLQVDQQGRRHHDLPRPRPCRRGRHQVQEPRAVRRPDPRRGLGEQDASLHGGR